MATPWTRRLSRRRLTPLTSGCSRAGQLSCPRPRPSSVTTARHGRTRRRAKEPDHERVRLPVAPPRAADAHAAADAGLAAAVPGVVQGHGSAGPPRAVRAAARAQGGPRRARQGGELQRRTVRRDEGRRHGLLHHRRQGPRRGRRAHQGPPHLRRGRGDRDPPDPEAVVRPDDALFRREAARLLATLTRAFGVDNLALAEDVVQETLAGAFEAWSYKGVPEHYSALLTTSAKNRAIDVLRRQRTARKFAPELTRSLESEWTLRPTVDELFLPDALKDDQLRMMFTCCHPRLHEDVQVALVLHLLCALGVDEIASAFLVSPAAIEKRLSRGKKSLAESRRLFELTADDFAPRLSAVHRALYLLFSEGYHGGGPEAVVRIDLCREAMRLVRLLVDHAPAATPATYALGALMWLDAARLPGRVGDDGELRPLLIQD